MASLSHLSDEDLMSKLKEYGISSPVTTSTRNILLKKLNHLISTDTNRQSSNKNTSGGRTKLNSQTKQCRKETENTHPIRVSPRSRISGTSKYSGIAKSETDDSSKANLQSFSSDEDAEDEEVEETPPRRSSRNISSDVARFDKSISTFRKRTPVVKERTGSSPLSSGRPVQGFLRLNNFDEFQCDTGSDSDFSDENDAGSSENRIFSSDNKYGLIQGNLMNNDVSKRMNNLSSYSPQSIFSSASRFRRDLNGIEMRSNFDAPLSIGDKITGEITSPDDIVSQESPSPNIQLANGQSPFDKVKKLTLNYCAIDQDFWLTVVPILLVALFLLFFCVVGLCYLSICPSLAPSVLLKIFQWKPNYPQLDSSGLEDTDIHQQDLNTVSKNKFPICRAEKKQDCLSQKEIESVTSILGILENTVSPALYQQGRRYQCGEAKDHHMTVGEVSDIIYKELPNTTQEDMDHGLNGLGKLTMLNPHWGIQAVWTDVKSAESQLIGFETTSYPIEILCHITNGLYNFLYTVLALLVCLSITWITFQILKYQRKQAEELEQKCFELVEQILEVLENSCGTNGKEFIAVNHVRDYLIPPRERRIQKAVWDKAVKFIDDHDSRVYREVRSVGGEDCEVWRWVSGAPRSPISCSKSGVPSNQPDSNQPPEKIWQGQAFESLETTQNLPQVSPTSCLKIRNMFDAEIEFGENWPSRIQDSLLEKCENIIITHVAVDRVSKEGCVYVKCCSAAEAGKAYRALHGWWFDGNLVTVKYLREERYFERFPTARLVTAPLIPSNNQRLSLQHYPSEPSKNFAAKTRSHNRPHTTSS